MGTTDRPDGITVINDAYSAGPDGMRAFPDGTGRYRPGVPAAAPSPSWGRCGDSGAESRAAHEAVGTLTG
jgi:UDP-N-acetylmuramyl pentapeptide synthase